MDSIDIYHSDGSFFVTIKPDDSSTQVKKIMGDNMLNLSFQDNRYLNFKINDYCIVFGERYQLNDLPGVNKVSRYLYKYSMSFFGSNYDLAKGQYLFYNSENELTEPDFSMMGSADDFINLLLQNISRRDTGWSKGQVIPTGYKNLTFSAESCYDALSRIAAAFDTEFAIEGKVIHLTARSNDTGFTFKHGRYKGLYEITRQNLDNSNIATRIYGFGSDQNLPADYILKGSRLRMPSVAKECLVTSVTASVTDDAGPDQTIIFTWVKPTSSAITAITIEYRTAGSSDPWVTDTGSVDSPRTITVPDGATEFRFRSVGGSCDGQVTDVITIDSTFLNPLLTNYINYLDRNTAVYGIIEYTKIFDDIFPHRTGIVTAVNAGDPFVFTDVDIDFNVNDQLLPGLTAKVTFNTGQLSGYTFDVSSFDNGLKQFRILKNADEVSLDIPSTLIRPAIGDEYVITDIQMPQAYIDEAEQELKTQANALLLQVSEPQLSYTIVLDPLFLKRRNRMLAIGDLVWIVDTELEVQRKIRVASTNRNIVNEWQLTVELSDIVTPGTIERIVAAQDSTGRDVTALSQQFNNNSILNNNVIGTLTFTDIPETSTLTGFSEIVIEDATGKLYKKV
jgi:hypothetical protein